MVEIKRMNHDYYRCESCDKNMHDDHVPVYSLFVNLNGSSKASEVILCERCLDDICRAWNY